MKARTDRTELELRQHARTEIAVIEEGAGQTGLGIMAAIAGLAGAWGLACMTGALANQGVGKMVEGLVRAITGM